MADIVHRGATSTISRLVAGPLDNNVLIVADTATNEAIVVDAAADPEAILAATEGLEVTAIVTTHGHWDHHQAAPEVADALGVPVLLHPADDDIAGLSVAVPLRAGHLQVGSTSIEIVHTPGHTPGSVSLRFDGAAITGDTLFPGGPGATRFPYSDFDEIIRSITDHLFTLPDATPVIPGHGAITTIGTERPQLQDWIHRRW